MDEQTPSPEDATGLAGALADKDPSVGLNAVWALRNLLERVERLQVDNARSQGWSWQQIARALRVTRQSVHEKHAARRKAMGMEA
jgi:hypothetical protein